jgi:hypothetical protein
MLANPSKRFRLVLGTFLLLLFLFCTSSSYAQVPNASNPSQFEPGDKTYTRNLFSGVFAFVSSVGILVLICMPSRKIS